MINIKFVVRVTQPNVYLGETDCSPDAEIPAPADKGTLFPRVLSNHTHSS